MPYSQLKINFCVKKWISVSFLIIIQSCKGIVLNRGCYTFPLGFPTQVDFTCSQLQALLAIPHNSAQLRAIREQLRATELRLETLLSKNGELIKSTSLQYLYGRYLKSSGIYFLSYFHFHFFFDKNLYCSK